MRPKQSCPPTRLTGCSHPGATTNDKRLPTTDDDRRTRPTCDDRRPTTSMNIDHRRPRGGTRAGVVGACDRPPYPEDGTTAAGDVRSLMCQLASGDAGQTRACRAMAVARTGGVADIVWGMGRVSLRATHPCSISNHRVPRETWPIGRGLPLGPSPTSCRALDVSYTDAGVAALLPAATAFQRDLYRCPAWRSRAFVGLGRNSTCEPSCRTPEDKARSTKPRPGPCRGGGRWSSRPAAGQLESATPRLLSRKPWPFE